MNIKLLWNSHAPQFECAITPRDNLSEDLIRTSALTWHHPGAHLSVRTLSSLGSKQIDIIRYWPLFGDQAHLYPMLVTNKHAFSLALTSVPTAVRLSLSLFSVSISFYVFPIWTVNTFQGWLLTLAPGVIARHTANIYWWQGPFLPMWTTICSQTRTCCTKGYSELAHSLTRQWPNNKDSTGPDIFTCNCRVLYCTYSKIKCLSDNLFGNLRRIHAFRFGSNNVISKRPYFDRRRALEPLVRFQNAQGCAKRRDRSRNPAELCTAWTLVRILSGSPNFSERSKRAHAKWKRSRKRLYTPGKVTGTLWNTEGKPLHSTMIGSAKNCARLRAVRLPKITVSAWR